MSFEAGEVIIRRYLRGQWCEAADFPFDGTHTGFCPEPGWAPLRLTGEDLISPLHRP